MSTTLRDTLHATAAQFREHPPRAQVTMTSDSRLGEGFRSEVQLREHRLTVDEPRGIGGSDAGPSPIELVLAALGTCQEITYRAFATALGIHLRGVAVRVEGDIDLRGFFGVDDTVRPGFERLRLHVALDTDASAADVQRLRETVNRHCPVLDMLSRPVPTSSELSVGGR